MKTQMTIVAAVLALGIAGIGAATLLPRGTNPPAIASTADLQSVSFTVENMTCATCPITVRRAMRGVDGVHDVMIDYEARTAAARFDPAATTAEAIAAASAEAGYPAQLSEG